MKIELGLTVCDYSKLLLLIWSIGFNFRLYANFNRENVKKIPFVRKQKLK